MSLYDSVRDQALALDVADRARLVDELMIELDAYEHEELSEAWKSEIDARLDAYRRGEITLIDAEDAKRRLGIA